MPDIRNCLQLESREVEYFSDHLPEIMVELLMAIRGENMLGPINQLLINKPSLMDKSLKKTA